MNLDIGFKLDSIKIFNITSQEILKRINQEFTSIAKDLWNKYLKLVSITKRFKAWWMEECNEDLFFLIIRFKKLLCLIRDYKI